MRNLVEGADAGAGSAVCAFLSGANGTPSPVPFLLLLLKQNPSNSTGLLRITCNEENSYSRAILAVGGVARQFLYDQGEISLFYAKSMNGPLGLQPDNPS